MVKRIDIIMDEAASDVESTDYNLMAAINRAGRWKA